MTEQQQPDQNTKEDRGESDRLLGPKSWTAIIAVTCVLGIALWVVISVLTARPSVDPTVHADAIALARMQQPDPDAPSQYQKLVEALFDFEARLARVEDEVAHERGGPGSGAKMLDFSELRTTPDPSDGPYYESHVKGAEDARRAAKIVLERNLFDAITALLQSPNLANEYPNAFDESGDLLPMWEWSFDELSVARKFSTAAVGCARALTESGNSREAAALLEDISPLPVVLTRHITLVDHLVGISIAALIASEIEHMVAHTELNAETIDILRRAHQTLSELRPVSIGIQGEAISMRDVHYRTHTAGGRYIPSVTEAMMNPASGPPTEHEFVVKLKDSWGYLAVRRGRSLALMTELHDLLIDASDEPDLAKRNALLAEYERKVDALDWHYDLLLYTTGYLSRLVETSFEQRARITALGIILAMAEHRLDHADWPTSLNQLVPDHLDAIPINPLTGNPFEYDHEPGEPPSLERLGLEDRY